jgi:hypothetical protein
MLLFPLGNLSHTSILYYYCIIHQRNILKLDTGSQQRPKYKTNQLCNQASIGIKKKEVTETYLLTHLLTFQIPAAVVVVVLLVVVMEVVEVVVVLLPSKPIEFLNTQQWDVLLHH